MLLPVETEWPRVERLKAERVIKEVLVCSGLRLRLERPLAGGEVGAALVVLPTGDHAVLTSWPAGQRARALAVDELQEPLRARGYPAPAYLEVVECGTVTAVVQEWIDGTPPQQVGPELLHALFELNDLQVGVLTEQGGSLDDLYLSRDGPGFCLHERLRRHSSRTSDLLGRCRRWGRSCPTKCQRHGRRPRRSTRAMSSPPGLANRCRRDRLDGSAGRQLWPRSRNAGLLGDWRY